MTVKHVVLGTGAIGRAVAEELIRRGEPVRMVNHSGRMQEAPAGAEIVAADLYEPAEVKRVTREAKVVYQSAQPHYDEWPTKFPPLQESIIDGLAGTGAKLVIVENLYMYGETDGRPLTEDLPYNAQTRKGRVRAALSEAALTAHREGKLRVTLGRGSDYFGPWGTDSSMGSAVFRRLLQGKAAQIAGSATMPHTHTYLADFGKALVILGERAEADGQAWHVPNDVPRMTQGELIQIIANQAGVNAKVQPAGKFILSVLGWFTPALKETVEMLYEFQKPFVVDSSRFERAFGLKATPVTDAVKETVQWYRSHSAKSQ